LVALLALSGCSKSSSDSASQSAGQQDRTAQPSQPHPTQASRWYRAELEKPGEEELEPIPFFLQVPPPGAEGKVLIRHGDVDIDAEHTWQGDRLAVRMPLFHTAIDATATQDGALAGTWSSDSRTWGNATLTFRARPIDAPTLAALFPAKEGSSQGASEGLGGADVSGVWRLKMADQSVAKLVLESRPGGVVGSYNASGGNIIRVAGTISGGHLRMSGFEGTMAFFLTATVKGDGIDGTWIPVRDKTWPEDFVGDRVQDFDFKTGPSLVEGETTLDVPGIDLSAYKGKPTIVEIAGSWCTNCMYAAPFMVAMYEKYHQKGLEIVTLTYEFTDDAAYNRQQAEAFKKKYGVAWEVIPVPGELDSAADILPPTLDGIDLSGLPLAIFIRPDGTIHHFHSGFPATGTEHYKTLTAQYESWIQELLGK
jgi:thiol-disulfide isomerase/thioredoxin